MIVFPFPFSLAYGINYSSSSSRFQYLHATLRKYQDIPHSYMVYWGMMKITIICYLHIRLFCITGHVYRWQQQSFPFEAPIVHLLFAPFGLIYSPANQKSCAFLRPPSTSSSRSCSRNTIG